MKRTLMFVAVLLIAVCSGTLALRLARAERSEAAPKRPISVSSDRAPVALSQEGKAYRQDVAKVLKRFDSLVLETNVVAEQVRQTGRLSIPTAAGTFDLTLTLHDLRAANYRGEVSLEGGEVRAIKQGPVRTYKGTVAGMKGAEARFTIDENTLEGLIITPSDLYFVEPASRYSALASGTEFIAYKASDLIRTTFGECATTMAEKVETEAIRVESQVPKVNGPVAEALFSPIRIVDLATEADFEYFTSFPSAAAANNEIFSIINQVEGIYNTQFGLQFRIVFQNVWATAGDPYTTSNPNAALTEFSNQWNSTRQGVARDLAHMWTGKDFEGSVIGIAYSVPGMECPMGSGGYGISQRLTGNPSPDKFLLTAHEIGHNFSATHTNGVSGCDNTIMGTTLGSTTLSSFCPFSVNEIETRANATQGCLSRIVTAGCSYSLSPTSQSIGVSGGSGSTNVSTAGTNCAWLAESPVSWITITSGSSGTNGGTTSFSAAPNSAGFARAAVISIGDQSFTVSQAGATACPTTPITYGQTLSGSLAVTDCRSSQGTDAFADHYSFSGAAGDQIKVEMTSTPVDTYLYLIGPGGPVLADNDDIVYNANTNSRIPSIGFFVLPAAGLYTIESSSFNPGETGAYTVTLTSNTPPPTPTPTPGVVQFSASSATATETLNATTKVDLTVTRTGSTSGAASIDYASSDATASERSDYLAALGTVRFLAGETAKTISVFIVDDSYGEGAETFSVTLSNPVGCTLGGPATATVTINSNETVMNGPNPVRDPNFSSDFFVRQHYVDFFNREADAAGLDYWKNEIDSCADQACREIKRINVSAAFFLSFEFQQTGYLVYKANQAAFATGETLQLRAFLADTQEIGRGVVVGAPGADAVLLANKQRVFLDFVQRPAFLAPTAYPTTLTAAQFVDKLNFNTIDLLSGPALTPTERDALVAQLSSDPTSPALRAEVLLSVSENPLFTQRQFNKAFVLMQFYGYMRRNPNDAPDGNFAGYNFWLSKLNEFNGNFVNAEMVKAFIASNEYILRFGP